MRLQFFKKTLLILSILAFLFPDFAKFDQEDLEELCQLEKITQLEKTLSKAEYRKLLEKCQKFYEKISSEIEKDIAKTEAEKKTLQNKIYILKNKIKNLSYQINQSNLMIRDLKLQIEETESSIQKTSLQIEDTKEKLIKILRLIYEEDQKTLVEILLEGKTLSDFFENLMALESLSLKNKEILKEIKELKLSLQKQKTSLDQEKVDLEKILTIQTLQKKESEAIKREKEYFLKLTEAEYQKYLKEKEEIEKRAAEIRARIFELIGVRKPVTYEQALEVAKYVAAQVGIRPALLLGVLSQESKIGKNVGQCFLKNPSTGGGVVAYNGKPISRVMNPKRDVPYFLEIIEELNQEKGLALDPFETLVSCPMSFGWGGAMGPAQFIPSTWSLHYKDRVEKFTGNVADPWDFRDASLAAALYLKDGIKKYGSEAGSIQSYFCGTPRGTYWCRWYEKNVLKLAQCHQAFIDKGTMSADCERSIF
jgi:peptidoglycan hydrolase CwlO-like protein